MRPKLHKTIRINEIVQKQQFEYINIEEIIIVEARTIVAGPVSHTRRISEILHIIMEPSISKVDQINIVLLEPHDLVLLILNHYILTFDMIFFIQHLSTGLQNCKTIYHYCDVSINNLSLKPCPSFQNSIIFAEMKLIFIRLKELEWELDLQLFVVISCHIQGS